MPESPSHMNFHKPDAFTTVIHRGWIIEAADTPAKNLRQIVTDHTPSLETQFLIEKEIAREELSIYSSTIQPYILLARLAILSKERDVLTEEAIREARPIYSDIGALNESYFEYWSELSATSFHPEIRRLKRPSDLAGVWLAIRPKEE